MDFCAKCGFLLPIELVGKTNTCRPCSSSSRQDTDRNANDTCQCEYCWNPFTNDRNSRNLNSNNNSISQNSPNPSVPRHSKNKGVSTTAPLDWSTAIPESPIDWSSEAPLDWGELSDEGTEVPSHLDEQSDQHAFEKAPSGKSRKKTRKGRNSSHQVMDWANPPLISNPEPEDWAAESPVGWDGRAHNDWGDYSMADDDFYVDTHDVTVQNDFRNKSQGKDVIFGDHDFPTLQKDLKESDVEESVRADWESQQNEYKQKLIIQDTAGIARLVSGKRRKHNNERYYIGGVDISFIKDNQNDACACLSIVRLPDLELVYQAMEMIKLTQIYIPGFLAFREVPPLMTLFQNLENVAPQYTPDVIMVDGNGILHPRGFGLASHLGVMLDKPTIGVAKTLISAQGIVDDAVHKLKKQKLLEAGAGFDLISQMSGHVLGKCVRVHDKAPNPVYVSVGHKISLKSAVWLVLECSKYRIPEPIRRADLDSREYIRQRKKKPEVFIM